MNRGWAFPLNARKAHYFPEGELISLCRRMMYAEERFDDYHGSSANCVKCKRLREKAGSEANNSE